MRIREFMEVLLLQKTIHYFFFEFFNLLFFSHFTLTYIYYEIHCIKNVLALIQVYTTWPTRTSSYNLGARVDLSLSLLNKSGNHIKSHIVFLRRGHS